MTTRAQPLRGLIAPNLTPFNDDMSIATDLYVDHANRLLEKGCAALAPFGTTGEALSVANTERMQTLDALVSEGIDPQCLVPGTGLTNLPETVELTRHAMSLGCRATLILPPFYFKSPAADGLFTYFDRLIEATGPEVRILLYHIPQIAGVGFSPSLVARLNAAFPDQIVGIKDSSGEWTNTSQLFEIDNLDVYPGSELVLLDALELGGPGCISATANLNSEAIIDVITRYEANDGTARAAQSAISARRLVFQDYAPIPAQKFLLAKSTGDTRWHHVRAPLLPLADEAGLKLIDDLSNLGAD